MREKGNRNLPYIVILIINTELNYLFTTTTYQYNISNKDQNSDKQNEPLDLSIWCLHTIFVIFTAVPELLK